MRRREFIGLLGGATAWPLAARAQQTKTIRKVGFVAGGNASLIPSLHSGFLQGMQELGYVEGKDFIVEWRFAEGNYDRFPTFGRELAQLGVDVIVLGTPAAVRPMMEASRTIPIIMGYSSNPVGNRFIDSLARPGGNVTGLASSQEDTTPKQIELLKVVVPGMARMGLLFNPNTPSGEVAVRSAEPVVQHLGIGLVPIIASDATQIATAFTIFSEKRLDALLVAPDAVFMSERAQIARIAIEKRLATMFVQREYVLAGGLMSYGEDLREFFRRTATYVDRIFKGANRRDLPVEQPTKFELVINLRTAKAIGLTVPPTLLARAHEVIE